MACLFPPRDVPLKQGRCVWRRTPRVVAICTIRRRRKGGQVCAAGTKTRPCAFSLPNDDSILADGLIRSLRHSGYAVNYVKTGIEADVALSRQSFDLLILDLGLPRMSGLRAPFT